MTDPRLLESLRNAVEAAPDDLGLQLHLAELLLSAGERDEALQRLGHVLQADPGSARALALIARAQRPEPGEIEIADVDWEGLEEDFADSVPPMFVEPEDADEAEEPPAWSVEHEPVTLADVGGLVDVKERLEVAFLAPLRNPELRRLYRKNLRGGLLLYGPPGCGKGFIARALAGEVGASFIAVSINDILDMWIGNSEQNLHDIFTTARRNTPVVLFFDELDALGRRRSQLVNSAMRTTVNQLLLELDGVGAANDDIFVLGATNHPWDVDPALRRPGRFDRTLLVLPPDEPAREAIFRTHLKDRPVAAVDLRRLARLTEGFSGADVAHACETAAERAMIHAVRTNEVRMIGMDDLEAAVAELRPSAEGWFDTARNVVSFANQDHAYDELLAYMKGRKML